MPVGGQGDRALYGHVGHPQNMTALLDTITKLKQDIAQSHAEKQNLAEQMNVLITLVKRSWSGDFNASLHLGNIIGLQPPEFMQPSQDGKRTTNTPAIPEIKEKVVRTWERLAIKLLDREYAQIQEEIHARQQIYMRNRQLYMDEVLQNHQQDMSKTVTPLRNKQKTYEEVDKQFLKTIGANNIQTRPTSGSSTRGRIRSAQKQQRTNMKENNPDVTLNDLFVQPAGDRNKTNSAFSGLYHLENGRDNRQKYRTPYDDPQRYKQTNLFDLDAVFGPDNGVKKPRPTSAFTATNNKDKTSQKPRPKSAGVFVTQLHDRPLKYEVTHPVSNKPSTKKKPAQKQRLKSASVPTMNIIQEQTGEETPSQENDTESQSSYQKSQDSPPSAPVATPAPDIPGLDINSESDFNQGGDDDSQEDGASSPGVHGEEYATDSSDEEPPEDHIGQQLRVRVNSATNKPKSVTKFVSDMKVMADMEKDFKKTAAQLQKRLGIAEMGMIK